MNRLYALLYKPLKAYEHKHLQTENGKKVIIFGEPKYYESYQWNETQIPCGKCIGCRMDYAQEWAVRCMLESKCWEHNYFVTLTYAPEHIHLNPVVDTTTGEYTEVQTLYKPDFTKFMKDLRRQHDYHLHHKGIRFYMCGEYGEKSGRPHYHALLFNTPIPDLKPFFINKNHQQVYISEYLSKVWGKGIVSIGEITYESRSYTRRYILKKQKINEIEPGKVPEFTNMSRDPGIGRIYYDTHKDDMYKNDEIIIRKALSKAISTKPPSYFDRIYDLENPEKMKEIKGNRKERALDARAATALNTSLSPMQYLEVKERNYAKRIATLKRGLKEEV